MMSKVATLAAPVEVTERFCHTCYRDEDDGAMMLVHVLHEDDLWCRNCIASFSSYNVREAIKTTQGPVKAPVGATIIQYPITVEV